MTTDVSTCAELGITAREAMSNLNGFDELAIVKFFDDNPTQLAKTYPQRLGRALIFVHYRHNGMKDPDAYKAAMELTLADVTGYFAPEEADQDDENPEGKGE